MQKEKILIGLSGWVDSAVSAYLLKQEWYDVTAGFMINYKEPENPECTTRKDYYAAKEVAEFLEIDFIHFDFSEEYQDRIIDYIFEGYQQGITPNPDVFCNNLIKFDLFLQEALKLGFDKIAMGHYASIKNINNINTLVRGKDPLKDQSYFLSRLNQYQLDHALLPLGNYMKSEVRALAKKIWLPNADRPDSQWLCFIGNVPMEDFLKRRLPERSGDIIDNNWKKVGTHSGAWFYTLGQRHRLFLPFKAYVTDIDIENNVIRVGEKDDEKLISNSVHIKERTRTWDNKNTKDLENCLVKIRYRQQDAIEASLLEKHQDHMTFSIPSTRSIAPGQILVAYTKTNHIIWSGIITD